MLTKMQSLPLFLVFLDCYVQEFQGFFNGKDVNLSHQALIHIPRVFGLDFLH